MKVYIATITLDAHRQTVLLGFDEVLDWLIQNVARCTQPDAWETPDEGFTWRRAE